jgi:hypothetical protein
METVHGGVMKNDILQAKDWFEDSMLFKYFQTDVWWKYFYMFIINFLAVTLMMAFGPRTFLWVQIPLCLFFLFGTMILKPNP